MKSIRVETGMSYNVHVGRGILGDCGGWVTEIPGRKYTKAVIIADDNVAPLYLDTVRQSLESVGIQVEPFIFPHGETSKNISLAMELAGFLSEHYITRSDVIIALGGGVTGDLVGFTAAIYQRGIDYVQIPTTFLAAIDSSVGGKTAVNIPQGKNLVGSFWQPRLVVCDTATLATLSDDTFADGVSEAIKYGCIRDLELFDLISRGELREKLEDVIARCVQIKADIVKEDEKDNALRRILNFGHTAGHAIEKLSGLTITHGKAVAIGMALACEAGERVGVTVPGTTEKVKHVLTKNNLPTELPYPVEDVRNACLGDKKREGGIINFILLKEIGGCVVYPVVTAKITEFLL